MDKYPALSLLQLPGGGNANLALQGSFIHLLNELKHKMCQGSASV